MQEAQILADHAGLSKATIWRLENPVKNGDMTLAALKNIAGVFDVGLVVQFCRWGELIEMIISADGVHVIPDFRNEQGGNTNHAS